MIEIMIVLDHKSNSPLYFQIYQQIKEKIFVGEIRIGEKLPSIRNFAKVLAVGKNTINHAYQLLIDEGLIISKPQSGYIVEPYDLLFLSEATVNQTPTLSPKTMREEMIDFAYGNTSKDDILVSEWIQFLYNAIDQNETNLIHISKKYGEIILREQIKYFIANTKGIRCEVNQIIVGSNVQQLLTFLTLLLNKANIKRVAYEIPTYHVASMIFDTLFETEGIELKENGLDIHNIASTAPQVLYVHSSHQLVHQVEMPYANRVDILKWAKKNDAFIIEDDFEAEYRDTNRMIPSIKSLDQDDHHVIYLGTFSPTILAFTNVSFLVVPTTLTNTFIDNQAVYEQPVPKLTQLALAEFLKSGTYERQVRKMRVKNFAKISEIKKAVKLYFGSKAKIFSKDLGIHILLEVRITNKTEEELIEEAMKENIKVYPTKKFWKDHINHKYPIILLGISNVSIKEIYPAIKTLANCWLAE